MAYTLEQVRDGIKTSVHGRRLGLKQLVSTDLNSEAIVGPAAQQFPLVDATSDTTGTVITGYGHTNVDTSTNDTWLLAAPIPGVRKSFYTGSTSTGIRTVIREAATFTIQTSGNSTAVGFIAQAGGLFLELIGITSTLYGVVSRPTGFSSACSTELALTATT